MNRAAVLPYPHRPDRLEAARNVVLRADRMSLIDAVQRKAILTLAWETLREDRDQRKPHSAAAHQPAPNSNVITLALARQQRRTARAADLGLPVIPRRPRIVVRPANPTTPGDAA